MKSKRIAESVSDALPALPETLLTYLDGLDASVDGRGYDATHDAARVIVENAVRRAETVGATKLFSVTPDFKNGGDEWLTFCRAATAEQAAQQAWNHIVGDSVPVTFRATRSSADVGTDNWTVHELPDNAPAGVIEWDAIPRTDYSAIY